MTEYCKECGRLNLPYVSKKASTGPFETREEFRKEVCALLESGMKAKDVALKFKVSDSMVSRLRNGDRKQTLNGYRMPMRKRKK